MRRYAALLIFTFIVTVAIAATGSSVKSSILRVDVTKLEPVSEVESVASTGKVEMSSNGDVYVPAHSVLKKIYVKVGQKVKAGQTLMAVDVITYGDNNVQVTDASVLEQNEALPKTQFITAPIGGTVSSVSVEDAGYYVDPTKPAVTIQNPSELQVRLDVNESQVSDLKAGQKAEITGSGFKNSSYWGTVKEISSEAKQIVTTSGQETVVEVLIGVEHANEDIKPGFTAKAKIITSNNTSVLVVPYSSVQAEQDGSEYVLRVVGGKTVKTPIITGREFDSGFEVKSGITKGDRIVIDSENVSDNTRVIPVLSKAVNVQ